MDLAGQNWHASQLKSQAQGCAANTGLCRKTGALDRTPLAVIAQQFYILETRRNRCISAQNLSILSHKRTGLKKIPTSYFTPTMKTTAAQLALVFSMLTLLAAASTQGSCPSAISVIANQISHLTFLGSCSVFSYNVVMLGCNVATRAYQLDIKDDCTHLARIAGLTTAGGITYYQRNFIETTNKTAGGRKSEL